MRLISDGSFCLAAALCLFSFSPGIANSEDIAPDAAGVQVELIRPGDEPRRVVRFTPSVGDKQTAAMTIKMNQKMTLGGNQLPSQPIPPQKITMEIEVTDVAENGDITFEFEYTDMVVLDDPGNPSPLAETLETALKPMIGSTGSGILSNRGITRKGEFNASDGLSPQLKQMLDGMKESLNRLSSPVPVEPIGRGAQWKVVQEVTANGMKLTQTSTHEILRIDENGFEMSVAIKQTAEPQDIQNPMLPPGTQLKLDSLDSNGTGKSTLMENSILPVSSQLTIQTVADMSLDIAGQKQQMKTEVEIEMLFD